MMNNAILTISFKDEDHLAQSYMPFVKNGGIFAATDKKYSLGDDLFMLITLPGVTAKMSIQGKVVWITPRNSSNKKPAGIGLQFSDQDNGETQKKFETMVGTKHRTLASTLTI